MGVVVVGFRSAFTTFSPIRIVRADGEFFAARHGNL